MVPDYVTLTYTCTIWTDFVAQMNKLIEIINYSSDTYWGDSERFKFNAKIDTYDNITEIKQGGDRLVKSNFGLKIQGYLLPDSLNIKLASESMKKLYSKSIITFSPEVVSGPSNARLTREEVREAPLAQNIEQGGEGIGYQIIGKTNVIG